MTSVTAVTAFTAVVAEDEPLARTMIASLLRRDRELGLVVECGDAAGVRGALARQRFDIAFLDIEMPGATGLEIAEASGPNGPIIVFVTAFSRYAPQAFEVNAVDYVLKPFSDERLFSALERAKMRVRERRLGELAGQMATVSAELKAKDAIPPVEYLTRLPCREGAKTILIPTADVLWIEAEDYYALIHSKRGRHLVRVTLAALQQRLDPRVFLRVHRTALVNVAEVTEIQGDERLVVVLSNGSQVPVSRSRRRDVEATLLPRLRAIDRSRS